MLFGLFSARVLVLAGCESSDQQPPAPPGDPEAEKKADRELREAVEKQEVALRKRGKKGEFLDD